MPPCIFTVFATFASLWHHSFATKSSLSCPNKTQVQAVMDKFFFLSIYYVGGFCQWSCEHLMPIHSSLGSTILHPGAWTIAKNIFQISNKQKWHTYHGYCQRAWIKRLWHGSLNCSRWFGSDASLGNQTISMFSWITLCIIVPSTLEPASKWQLSMASQHGQAVQKMIH